MNANMIRHLSIVAGLAILLAANCIGIAQTRPAAQFSNASPILFREGGAGLPPYPVVVRDETPGEHEARMKWFREARFGMFVHWGVYSVPAGSWQGRPVSAEWIMNRARIPIAEYKPLAQQFTAAKYDPKAWADLAKDAGMKYVVLTAKHHDGFALYDSAVSDWNVVKASAAKRDLIQPLADAVQADGLKFGLYYSQSQDWTNLGGGKGNTQPWDPEQEKGSFDDYLTKIVVPQVREILEKYNPAYLFFDTEYSMTPERARPIFDLTCNYPDLIINNRLGGGVLGDTGTPEQRIATDPLGRAFEVCMTINGSWGYNTSDNRYKSAQQLIRNLSDITSKGGNYLLNVGPTPEGLIPPQQVERLQAIGKWMHINSEAIYGTEAGPFSISHPPAWGRATQKTNPATGATTLYVHVWNWPADGKLVLDGIQQTAQNGHLLASGANVSLGSSPAGLVLTLPGNAPDPDVSVVALQFASPMRIARKTGAAMQSESSGTPLDPSGGTQPK